MSVHTSFDISSRRTLGTFGDDGLHSLVSPPASTVAAAQVNGFTTNKVEELKLRIASLSRRCGAARQLRASSAGAAGREAQPALLPAAREPSQLVAEADDICRQLVELERFVTLNALGFGKIAKKCDRQLGQDTLPFVLGSG